MRTQGMRFTAPAPRVGHHGGRRGRGIRCRRSDRGSRLCGSGSADGRGHQRRAGRRVDEVGAGRDSGSARRGRRDTPEQHLRDTLVAGAGLCDEDAVHLLVTEGPAAVRRLIGAGARFDAHENRELRFTREGSHNRRRIVHAGGDATGAEMSRALVAAVRQSAVDLVENAFVLDLLKDAVSHASTHGPRSSIPTSSEGTHRDKSASHKTPSDNAADPQDHARPARTGEVRGALRWRDQPSACVWSRG